MSFNYNNIGRLLIIFVFSVFPISLNFSQAEFPFPQSLDEPIEFENGVYKGESIEGWSSLAPRIPHGEGVFTFSDGSKYKGKFKKNNFHGEGEYMDSKGKTYSGKWKKGKLKNYIDKKTREVINLSVYNEKKSHVEIKSSGSQWYEAELKPSGEYELTAKGQRDQAKKERKVQSENETFSSSTIGPIDHSSGMSGGLC